MSSLCCVPPLGASLDIGTSIWSSDLGIAGDNFTISPIRKSTINFWKLLDFSAINTPKKGNCSHYKMNVTPGSTIRIQMIDDLPHINSVPIQICVCST